MQNPNKDPLNLAGRGTKGTTKDGHMPPQRVEKEKPRDLESDASKHSLARQRPGKATPSRSVPRKTVGK